MYLPHRTVYKTEWDQEYKYHQQGILLIIVKSAIISCVAWGKLLHVSVPQCPHLQNGHSNIIPSLTLLL